MANPNPPPIPPLDYQSPVTKPKRPSLFLIIFGLITSKTTRRIYLILCSIGLIFVIRFLLHYRQMLEDAMKQK